MVRASPLVTPFALEEVTDPSANAPILAQHERLRRNGRWLETHWPELLPQARGKFIAVAGEQAFVAATSQEARAQAAAAHPDDDGLFVYFVPTTRGPRVYANHGTLAAR